MRKTSIAIGLIAAALAVPVLGAEDEDADAVRAAAPVGVLERGVPGLAVDRGAPLDRTPIDRPGIDRPGPGAFFAGVADSTAATQVFRFANAGKAAGTVTATLYDAASGASIGTWTSASIPVGAAIEVTAARIAAETTPVLTATQRAAPLNIAAAATFRGTAQQLSKTATVIVNQSDCSANWLGYVEGPGFVGATGAVRFVNASSTAGTITLSLRDAATGTELGKYTSASVPAKGALTVTTAAMAAAATPAVPASTAALGIVPTAATTRIGLDHLATVTASAVVSNLSAACGI